MADVTHGADPERLDEIAGQLGQMSSAMTTVGMTGSQMLALLGDVWQGPDSGYFNGQWSSARQRLDQAADLLQQASSDLRRQAEDQRSASEGGGPLLPAAGATGGRGAEPGPGEPEAEDNRGWWDKVRDRVLNRDEVTHVPDLPPGMEDPGEGNVTLPEGADPDHPAIKEMLSTPRGRATLQWMADNEIRIVFSDLKKGASYSPHDDTMVIGPDYQDGDTIVHEASHARWDVEGKRGDVNNDTRTEYVERQISNEVNAVTEEIYYAKERRLQGDSVERTPMEKAYDAAYTEAIEAGHPPEAADTAGRRAIRDRFEEGEVKTSTNGKDYPTYYGDQWDDAN